MQLNGGARSASLGDHGHSLGVAELRVIDDVLPLLCVGFGSTQLPIPKVTLPNRNLGAMRPCPRDLIFPVRDPLLQRLRRKRIWCAE